MLPGDVLVVTQLLGCVMNHLTDDEFPPGNTKLFRLFLCCWAQESSRLLETCLCTLCMMKFWTKSAWVISGL